MQRRKNDMAAEKRQLRVCRTALTAIARAEIPVCRGASLEALCAIRMAAIEALAEADLLDGSGPVPLVEIDGVERFRYEVTADDLRDALAAGHLAQP